jgi:hypothetical protein
MGQIETVLAAPDVHTRKRVPDFVLMLGAAI